MMGTEKNGVEKAWQSLESWMYKMATTLLRREVAEDAWQKWMQFVKFCVVGLSNTLLGYVIYAISLKLLRAAGAFPKGDYLVAQGIMFVLSVAWSFYWNNKYVFRQEEGGHRNLLAALLKTYASYALTGLVLSELLLMLWVGKLGINAYIAPILNLLVTVPLNFVLQKIWAFKS